MQRLRRPCSYSNIYKSEEEEEEGEEELMVPVMILSAGKGTRLGDLCQDTPKPLLKVAARPILEWNLRHLVSLGFKDVIINLNYLGEKIVEYFGDGHKLGLRLHIHYSLEKERALGTAGGVKHAEDIIDRLLVHSLTKPFFFVLYGDILCNYDYRKLLQLQEQNYRVYGAEGTILLHKRQRSNSIIVMDEKGEIAKFMERPREEEVLQHLALKEETWVNSGLYCFHQKILSRIADGEACDFPANIFPLLMQERRLFGKALEGYRIAIDSKERYLQAQMDLKKQGVFCV
ncbi:MAG: NDP-sugar synthase [Oligoflexia bacterium]|nr:NDP-sugar synthase [Oligoflexia bacterium]